MPEKKVEEKKEKQNPISISDWLVFLESNASSNITLYVLIMSFLIALSISSIGLDGSTNLISLANLGIILFVVIVLFLILWKSTKQIKNYQRLSQKIILEEITDIEEIREEYEKFKKKI